MAFPFTSSPTQVNPNLGDSFNQPTLPIQGKQDAGLVFCHRGVNTGPWVNGSNFYCATISFTEDFGTFFIQMQKSTNNGVTWTEMDSAHHPFIYGGKGVSCELDGTTPTFLYPSTTNGGGALGLAINTFNFGTDLWGTPTSIATGSNHIDVNTFGLVPSGGGGYVIAWTLQTGALFQIFRSIYAAGVWDGGTQIAMDTTNPTITGWWFDGTLAHMFYTQRIAFQATQPSPNVYRHLTIAQNGTVSASNVVDANAVNSSFTPGNCFTWPEIDGPGATLGSVLIAPTHGSYSAGDYQPAVYVYNGATWSGPAYLSIIPEDAVNSSGPFMCAVVRSGTVYVFWFAGVFFDGFGNPQFKIRYVTTTDGITFSAPLTAYDYIAFPPPSGNITDIGPLNVVVKVTNNVFNLLFTYMYADRSELPTAFFSAGSPTIQLNFNMKIAQARGVVPVANPTTCINQV